MRVYNPNTYALPVDRVECDVLIDSRPAATSRSVHVDPLPPMGEAKVELSGRLYHAVATAMMSIGSQLPIDYVVGHDHADHGTVAFAHKGRIPVARFDRASARASMSLSLALHEDAGTRTILSCSMQRKHRTRAR